MIGELIEARRFKAAINEAMALADRVNQFVSQQAPMERVA
jgi:methionyl-tRNA synthetase